jgi:hypothetical protein
LGAEYNWLDERIDATRTDNLDKRLDAACLDREAAEVATEGAFDNWLGS